RHLDSRRSRRQALGIAAKLIRDCGLNLYISEPLRKRERHREPDDPLVDRELLVETSDPEWYRRRYLELADLEAVNRLYVDRQRRVPLRDRLRVGMEPRCDRQVERQPEALHGAVGVRVQVRADDEELLFCRDFSPVD